MFDIPRYPAAQETENYTEDAITSSEQTSLASQLDNPPIFISGDRLKALFPQFKRSQQNLTFEEACQHTILDFSDNLPESATLANIACHSSQQCA